MAHLHKKMKKDRPYYYVREMARVDGKLKVVEQIYLGSPERIKQLATAEKGTCTRISVREFGALWLANLPAGQIDLAGIVDSVAPRMPREKGPTIGEYFLYAVLNRMVEARSKRALPTWYQNTAIQHIRPVDVNKLNSQRYWEKWERVAPEQIEQISSLFFSKVRTMAESRSDCFLFDTTNYYSYMAGQTESELAKRGKNKDGKDWLRQVGVALLASREGRLPLFYREYEGNRHDSKVFWRVMDEAFSAMRGFADPGAELTIVFDKGMNAQENIERIDACKGFHFITTYSTHFAEEFLRAKLCAFKPVDSARNRELERLGKEDDRIVAWRGAGEFWGKERTVVVTYNPRTAAKQRYGFDRKLLELQEVLYELRSRAKSGKAPWNQLKHLEKHYLQACEKLYLPNDLYQFDLEKEAGKPKFVFRKDYYRIGKHIERFGKNIIVTDHANWSTDEIVRASLDRYLVEEAFRQSKDDELVSVLPMRHWTDGKIRCHIFTCMAALTYLRVLENRLAQAGIGQTAAVAMESMRNLHSCLCWYAGKSKPQWMIEEPTEDQSAILRAFGHKIASGVLQKLSG
ncbi:IS1634 family transposase [Syntrophobacter fumaroxidans]